MCVISMVMDMGQKFPEDYWTLPNIDHFRDLTRRAREHDKKHGLEDCVDPEKEKLLKRIELLERKILLTEKRAKLEEEFEELNSRCIAMDEELSAIQAE